jgi:sodium-dependent dicarboxylate transporter 2/3/5
MEEERNSPIEQEDARRPFLRRRDTWLVLVGLLLIPLACWLPIDAARHADLDAAKLRLGLGIFLCIAFLWVTEALPLAATALLVPVLGVLAGVMDMKSALAGFADPLIFLFFGGFALASAMSVQGLDRWIADRIVRAAKGKFLRVSYLIFAVTAGLSMWMSNTATTAIMIPLVIGILGHASKDDARRGNAIFLLLGTAYAASIGGLGTLVGTPPNGIAAAKLGIDFVGWLRFGIPSMLVLLPLMAVVLHVTCKPARADFALSERRDFDWHGRRVTMLVIFLLTGLAWIFGGLLAPQLGIANSFDTVVALLAVLALVSTRVAGWKDIEAGTEWGVLLLFGGGIALSALLDKTGASLFMARDCAPGRRLAGGPDHWGVAAIRDPARRVLQQHGDRRADGADLLRGGGGTRNGSVEACDPARARLFMRLHAAGGHAAQCDRLCDGPDPAAGDAAGGRAAGRRVPGGGVAAGVVGFLTIST